ncbi:hypothetical protein ACU6FY_004579 [Vibrio alginolyticus]
MAIWQFSVVLIPASWAEENSYSSSSLYDDEGYDTAYLWKDRQPVSDLTVVFDEIPPPSKSWDRELLVWGNEKEHDIQVWYDGEAVESIHIRLDLNHELCEIINKVIKAAIALDCVLFFPEFKSVVMASESELKHAIKKSNAAKFMSDPKGFFNNVKEKT